jgi:hypothetical protein
VAAALAGVVGAGALWHLLGRPERAMPLTATASASASAPPTTISWSITSEPAGAEVIGLPEGTALGRTPLLQERAPAPGVQGVVLQKPGYSEQRLDLRRDQAMKVHAVLQPEAAPPAARKPAAKAALGKGGKAPAKVSRPVKRTGPLHNSEVKLFND